MRRLLLVSGLLLLAATALIVACGDDDDNDGEGDVGAMLAALDILNDAGIHHMNLALVEDDAQIDPAWLGQIRNARTAVAVVDWPEDVESQADDFLAKSALFESALADDDVAAAAGTIVETHAAFHVLSGNAFAMLATRAGLTSDANSHEDHAMDDGTMDDDHVDEEGHGDE